MLVFFVKKISFKCIHKISTDTRVEMVVELDEEVDDDSGRTGPGDVVPPAASKCAKTMAALMRWICLI